MKYEAYTDGGCNNLSPYGEGGAAYIVLYEGKEIVRASKGFIGTTNNRMELLAAFSAVMSIPDGEEIMIYTDSRYVISVLSISGFPNLNNYPNADILKNFYTMKGDRKVHFTWVKGHNGNKLNEECDRLARQERENVRIKNGIEVYSTKNSPKVAKNKDKLKEWIKILEN